MFCEEQVEHLQVSGNRAFPADPATVSKTAWALVSETQVSLCALLASLEPE